MKKNDRDNLMLAFQTLFYAMMFLEDGGKSVKLLPRKRIHSLCGVLEEITAT